MKSIELSNREIEALLQTLQIEQANCKLYNATFSNIKKELISLFEGILKE